MFGYAHLTGGWEGGQAEYLRVPFGEPIEPAITSDHSPAWWHQLSTPQGGRSLRVVVGAGPCMVIAASVRGGEMPSGGAQLNDQFHHCRHGLMGEALLLGNPRFGAWTAMILV